MATDDWLVNGTAGWTTGADWSTGSVPASGDDVLIGTNSHAATIKSASDVTIHTLEITTGDTLDLTGGNFNVTNGLPFGNFGFIDVDSANFQIDGGTINNSATIDLSPSGNITTDLTIYNSVQLNGAGSIVFAGNGNDGILGGTPTAALTDFDNNISGSGFIEGLVFTNHTTIETNNVLGAGTLRIVGSAYGGSFDNENSLFADNGGTVELGDWAGTASSTILDDDGAISLLSTGAVTTLEIANSVTITTTGAYDGLIGLDGTHPEDDRIISNGKTASLTLGENMTVLNTGTIGDAHLTLTNDGYIRATADTLVVNTGANTIINGDGASMVADSRSNAPSYLDIQSAVQDTGGSIYAGPNGLVTFDQAVTISNTSFNTGSIGTSGGSVIFFKSVTNNGVIADGGTMTVHSSIFGSSNSQIDIGTDSLLDLAVGGTVSQSVTFTGGGAVLELDQNAGQIGTNIAGAVAGDAVDLKFLTYAPGDHVAWSQISTYGQLSILSQSGSILAATVWAGSWNTQDFVVTADSTGNVLVSVKNPAAPAGTAAAMIMHTGTNGSYEVYDIGNNSITAAAALDQIGTAWQVAGLGDFSGADTADMMMRNSSTGAFQIYDLSNNNITAVNSVGQVGLEWSVAGFADFSGNATETDMLMRSTNGSFELYDVANNQFTGFHSLGQVGPEWSVAGFGDFSGNTGETDMLMRNTSTGAFELYDIVNNNYVGFHSMGQVGLEWSVVGFGDFSGNANESDMLMRSSSGAFELYDISNNNYSGFHSLGQVGPEWQVSGFGDFSGNTNETDMLMRNSSTGAFELYDISNNQLTGFHAMGQVGPEWTVAGIAADPPGSSSGTSSAQMTQAIASLPSSGSGITTPAAPPSSTDPSQQTLLTTPQPG